MSLREYRENKFSDYSLCVDYVLEYSGVCLMDRYRVQLERAIGLDSARLRYNRKAVSNSNWFKMEIVLKRVARFEMFDEKISGEGENASLILSQQTRSIDVSGKKLAWHVSSLDIDLLPSCFCTRHFVKEDDNVLRWMAMNTETMCFEQYSQQHDRVLYVCDEVFSELTCMNAVALGSFERIKREYTKKMGIVMLDPHLDKVLRDTAFAYVMWTKKQTPEGF